MYVLWVCALQEPDVMWTGFGTKNVLYYSPAIHFMSLYMSV